VSEVWDFWVPGALSRSQLQQLRSCGFVKGVAKPESFDHSALDLHLTNEAYRLTRGSVKPFGRDFLGRIQSDALVVRLQPDSEGRFVLNPHETYLFRLQESIEGDGGQAIWGQATAKSSVGRLDVLVRLIVDGMNRYEGFDPTALRGASSTDMFVEVTPITFAVVVKAGDSLNQLRLFYGAPEDCELKSGEVSRTCLHDTARDHHLTVDLTAVEICGRFGCGFRATSPSINDAIPLWSVEENEKPNPSQWWELVAADRQQRLTITKNHFYILRSKELLSVPPGVAVYARAIDEEIGEMRIHYAGFAHPFFGWKRRDGQPGTPLIFEVRGHDVDVSLRHGEILARLQFFRMSEDAAPMDGDENPYNEQTLQLSKYLGKWTSAPRLVSAESSD
jgi:dCTP deaminase